ncbi:acrosomal protein SP-10 isoform X1 [Carlito syrichta]|uniref:Acrosomal protein SP-10 isoform X1 n=1 Tax=Carlito syrichta TaxID=1868482 RepID=A0A1U7UUQ5_CARSF|nr:acrosomal protein SP-10 isoform X1 [Carlito syrichta]
MKFLLLISLSLLGSAGGASGQPDEPSGSIDHQASVQQLPGEYFSLANPSNAEALYETSSGENTLSEHSSSEHGSSEHAMAEHTSEEHPAAGEHASAEHAAGEHAAGEHAAGEHTSSEQPSGEHASSEQPVAEHTLGEHASSEQPVGEHVSSDQPSGEHVSGEQPSGEHAAGEQPSDAPLSSTSLGAMLNCHTCAYMNNQGQCLRGEGICTTQKSQQCMLKKIFEGGKLQFMVQGCENMCPSMNLFSHGTRMQIICCRNQSFCNKI